MNILKEYGGFLFVSEINNLQLRRNVLYLYKESLNGYHPEKLEHKITLLLKITLPLRIHLIVCISTSLVLWWILQSYGEKRRR